MFWKIDLSVGLFGTPTMKGFKLELVEVLVLGNDVFWEIWENCVRWKLEHWWQLITKWFPRWRFVESNDWKHSGRRWWRICVKKKRSQFIVKRSTRTTFLDEIIEHTTDRIINLSTLSIDSWFCTACLIKLPINYRFGQVLLTLYCLSDKFTDILLFARVNYWPRGPINFRSYYLFGKIIDLAYIFKFEI